MLQNPPRPYACVCATRITIYKQCDCKHTQFFNSALASIGLTPQSLLQTGVACTRHLQDAVHTSTLYISAIAMDALSWVPSHRCIESSSRLPGPSAVPTGSFLDDDDDRGWRRVIDIDLTAALHGVRLAARHMSAAGGGGTIMVVASAGGVFPIPGNSFHTISYYSSRS